MKDLLVTQANLEHLVNKDQQGNKVPKVQTVKQVHLVAKETEEDQD